MKYEDTYCLKDVFSDVDEAIHAQWQALGDLYAYWNERINLISRKDLTYLFPRHILHSLAVAKIVSFQPGMHVLDLGTGGGFPGIPLAILFPKTHFYLVDSIQKKIKAVEAISQAMELKNVTPLCQRAETLEQTFDFILSRAVASLPKLYNWTKGKVKRMPQRNTQTGQEVTHGLLCWKGGDLTQELATLPISHRIYPLKEILKLPFFDDKSIVHLF
ncbi:MAG: 16S rRNA (guanine(527)-N(7))-methyltransferase RsmG [Bacteroidota bacterium]